MDATPVVYTIALKGSSIVVSGVDESDGTELRISGVSWDGSQLRFKSLYPPTNHKASHVFRLTAKDRAIHTTSLEALKVAPIYVSENVTVCLDCGFAELVIPLAALQVLQKGDAAAGS